MSLRICTDCGQEKPIADFRRPRRSKLLLRCAPCLETWRNKAKPRDYYHSPEYKRIQWERKCKREGRAYVPGTGMKSGHILREYTRKLKADPSKIAEATWRRLELKNAREAWAYWLKAKAPAWWLGHRARIQKERDKKDPITARVCRAARRARKKTQADGTLSNADLANMIRNAKECMWCGVAVTLPVHKRYEPTMATIEHIKPLCQGGLHSRDNVGIACARCNYSRPKKAA